MQVTEVFPYTVVMGGYDWVNSVSATDDPKVDYMEFSGGFMAKARRMKLSLEGVKSEDLDGVIGYWKKFHKDLLISLTVEAVILINGVQALLEPEQL
jgi:hypothetical protein